MKYEITKEQLISLTDPKVKEMFPEAFKDIVEAGKWYKSQFGTIAFCGKLIDGQYYFTMYRVASDGYFNKTIGGFGSYIDWVPATQEEVFDELKRVAIKMGYKKGLYCIFGSAKDIRAIEGGDFSWKEKLNALVIGNDCIFQDGEWTEIVNKNLL
jgi:hypothetical protein